MQALTKEAVARTIGAIDLTWTGPVTIGSENITLTGTAEVSTTGGFQFVLHW